MISSPGNIRVKAVRKLHRAKGRREAGRTLLEGPRLVEVALAAGVDVEVWSTESDGDVHVSREVLTAISTTETPQSPVGVMPIPEPEPLRSHPTVVLWEVHDPGNVGTILRTAFALGWDACVTPGTAEVWSPKVLRAGAGAHFLGRIAAAVSVSELRDAGLEPVASVVTGGVWPLSVAGPLALLIGSEPHGLPEEAVSAAAVSVTLPMAAGTPSLNAAMAAGILMWELGSPPTVLA